MPHSAQTQQIANKTSGLAEHPSSGAPVPGTDDAGPPPVPFKVDVLPTRRILRRFSHLLILTTLAAVPLIYPFHITEPLDYSITRRVLESGSGALQYFWVDQIQPALFSGYSPLTLKRVVWAILTLALATTHLLWKFLPDRPRDTAASRRLSIELLAIMGFLLWSGLSIFLWLPAAEGTDGSGGGFLHSLDAWSDLAIAVGFFFLTSDLLRRRRWVFKGIGILFAVATLIALLAIGQRQGWTRLFLTRWGPEDLRNRMASLVGHNTGLASFLMTPALLSLALGLPRWRQLRRPVAILLGVFWLILALTLITSQSRGVLLILFVAVPVLLWKLHRTSGLSPGRNAWTLFAALLVFVLLSQLIPARWNPFYDRAIPLTRRIHDLSLERLKAETRLRILVCSGPLIAQAPLHGNGFGSFQYVYPIVQGHYFQEYPDSILVPTGKRTERAHNEYLQILIETGGVGVALAVLSLVFIVRRGWLAYSRTLRPDDIPMQIGLVTAIVAVLVHAVIDFPFRVPPVGVTLVWCLAVWQAGGKIWLPRRGRYTWPEDDDTAVAALPAAVPSVPPTNPETPFVLAVGDSHAIAGGSRGRWALWSLSVVLVQGAMILASAWYSRRLVADVLATRGDHFFQTFLVSRQDTPARQRMALLKDAREIQRRALRLRPVDGEVHFLKAFVEYYLAREAYAQAVSAGQANAQRERDYWLSNARGYIQSSLVALQLALAETRYHQVFHLRGEDYRLLGEIQRDPKLLQNALEEMETSIKYTPAYPESVISLIRLIEDSFPQFESRRRSLLALLHKYNRKFFYEYFVILGDKAVENERYDDAIRIFKDLSEAVPGDYHLVGVLASAYLDAGDFEKCEAALTELSQAQPRPVLYDTISAALAVHRKQWDRALAHLNQALRHPDGDLDYYRIMRLLALREKGETEEAKLGIKTLRSKAEGSPQLFLDFANVLADQFNNEEEAVTFIREYRNRTDLPTPARLLFILARHTHQHEHNTGEAIRLLKEALRLQPDHAACRRLLNTLLEKSDNGREGPAGRRSPNPDDPSGP